ncbi:MAG TPA: Type 1 glutamine amidotransferase-like domain-containing protein [Acidimicrobiia bacterium]|nr:Type 1 glutamine amidotransferase-like domain-containing protein [Acidimicrobiia bacterium]
MSARGTVALIGGGEWTAACRPVDERLLAVAGGREVVVLTAAAAFEHPDRVSARAADWFAELGAKVSDLGVLTRRDAENDEHVRTLRAASFIYIADGSPLHLRSVLKGSALYDAMIHAYEGGAVLAASGAGATVLCDPMVDPRGGAFTVGLGLVSGVAVFPYHGSTAEHLRERSVDLLAPGAVLLGIDEHTAVVRSGNGKWEVVGPGAVTLYKKGAKPKSFKNGKTVELA